MASKVLVTGGNGFIGQALLNRLRMKTDRSVAFVGDVTNLGDIEKNFQAGPFDFVVHLAGMSSPPQCERDPAAAYHANVVGTTMIADAVLKYSPQARLIFASTSQVYQVPDGSRVELSETSATLPLNVYSRSKLIAEEVIETYCHKYSLKAVVLRLFNHSHSTQAATFVLPGFVEQLRLLKAGEVDHLSVGNLNVERGFSLPNRLLDIFEKLLVAESQIWQQSFTVMNICSGQARSLLSLLNLLAEKMGVALKYEVDPKRLRANDPPLVIGNPQRLLTLLSLPPRSVSDAEFINEFFAPMA